MGQGGVEGFRGSIDGGNRKGAGRRKHVFCISLLALTIGGVKGFVEILMALKLGEGKWCFVEALVGLKVGEGEGCFVKHCWRHWKGKRRRKRANTGCSRRARCGITGVAFIRNVRLITKEEMENSGQQWT